MIGGDMRFIHVIMTLYSYVDTYSYMWKYNNIIIAKVYYIKNILISTNEVAQKLLYKIKYDEISSSMRNVVNVVLGAQLSLHV